MLCIRIVTVNVPKFNVIRREGYVFRDLGIQQRIGIRRGLDIIVYQFDKFISCTCIDTACALLVVITVYLGCFPLQKKERKPMTYNCKQNPFSYSYTNSQTYFKTADLCVEILWIWKKKWIFIFRVKYKNIYRAYYTLIFFFRIMYCFIKEFKRNQKIDWFFWCHGNATFSNISARFYIMATSFSGGRSRSTRREPSTMIKQLVNFITSGCESSA